MDNLTPQGRETEKGQKENLTVLGQWYYALCDYIGVDGTEIARRAGIPKATVSRGTRDAKQVQTFHLSGAKVLLLRDKIKEAILEQGLEVQMDWETYFLNAAGYASPMQTEEALLALDTFRASIAPKRRRRSSQKQQRS